jgi:hypothetical protein
MYNNNERVLHLSPEGQQELIMRLRTYIASDTHAGWRELSRFALANTYSAMGRDAEASYVMATQVLLPLVPLTPPNQAWRSVAHDAPVTVMAVSSEVSLGIEVVVSQLCHTRVAYPPPFCANLWGKMQHHWSFVPPDPFLRVWQVLLSLCVYVCTRRARCSV